MEKSNSMGNWIDDRCESNVGLGIIIDWVWCKFSEWNNANNIEFDQVRSIDFSYLLRRNNNTEGG